LPARATLGGFPNELSLPFTHNLSVMTLAWDTPKWAKWQTTFGCNPEMESGQSVRMGYDPFRPTMG
jgi:hypothetical protein